jgi:hypothetical protein
MVNRRKLVKLPPLRRLAASVLLFLLVGDLAFHVAESFVGELVPESSSESLFTGLQNGFHGDESNCPIPGHSGGRFHHHHFPGVIRTHRVVAPVSIQLVIIDGPTELSGSTPLIAHPGRAPPLA